MTRNARKLPVVFAVLALLLLWLMQPQTEYTGYIGPIRIVINLRDSSTNQMIPAREDYFELNVQNPRVPVKVRKVNEYEAEISIPICSVGRTEYVFGLYHRRTGGPSIKVSVPGYRAQILEFYEDLHTHGREEGPILKTVTLYPER